MLSLLYGHNIRGTSGSPARISIQVESQSSCSVLPCVLSSPFSKLASLQHAFIPMNSPTVCQNSCSGPSAVSKLVFADQSLSICESGAEDKNRCLGLEMTSKSRIFVFRQDFKLFSAIPRCLLRFGDAGDRHN